MTTSAPRTVAVFGASGRTGRALLAVAKAEGVLVRALYRPQSAPQISAPNVSVIAGDLRTAVDVGRTLAVAKAVVCVFGPRVTVPDAFCADATAVIVEEMRRNVIGRLVCVTGAMIGDGAGCRSMVMELFTRVVARRYPAVAADRARQEEIVQESGLDWLIVKPPRLTDHP